MTLFPQPDFLCTSKLQKYNLVYIYSAVHIALYGSTTSTGIPVPQSIDMGDLANNWEFFKESWTNYKIATELDTKSDKIRVDALLATIGKEMLQIQRRLPMTKEECKNAKRNYRKTEGLLQVKKKRNSRKKCFIS